MSDWNHGYFCQALVRARQVIGTLPKFDKPAFLGGSGGGGRGSDGTGAADASGGGGRSTGGCGARSSARGRNAGSRGGYQASASGRGSYRTGAKAGATSKGRRASSSGSGKSSGYRKYAKSSGGTGASRSYGDFENRAPSSSRRSGEDALFEEFSIPGPTDFVPVNIAADASALADTAPRKVRSAKAGGQSPAKTARGAAAKATGKTTGKATGRAKGKAVRHSAAKSQASVSPDCQQGHGAMEKRISKKGDPYFKCPIPGCDSWHWPN